MTQSTFISYLSSLVQPRVAVQPVHYRTVQPLLLQDVYFQVHSLHQSGQMPSVQREDHEKVNCFIECYTSCLMVYIQSVCM